MQSGSTTVQDVPTMTAGKFLDNAILKMKEKGTYPLDFTKKYFSDTFGIPSNRVSAVLLYKRIGEPINMKLMPFMRKFADLYLQSEALKLFIAYNRRLGLQAIAAKRQQFRDAALGYQWEGVVADPVEEQLDHTEFFIDLDGYPDCPIPSPAEKAVKPGQSVIACHFGLPPIGASASEIDNSMFTALGNDLENAYSRGMGDPFGREVEMD